MMNIQVLLSEQCRFSLSMRSSSGHMRRLLVKAATFWRSSMTCKPGEPISSKSCAAVPQGILSTSVYAFQSSSCRGTMGWNLCPHSRDMNKVLQCLSAHTVRPLSLKGASDSFPLEEEEERFYVVESPDLMLTCHDITPCLVEVISLVGIPDLDESFGFLF